jgi:hypothetical protein
MGTIEIDLTAIFIIYSGFFVVLSFVWVSRKIVKLINRS